MLKALKAFSHAGIEVEAGQEVNPYTFEADDVQGLIRKGLLEDTEAKKQEPKAVAPKVVAARSKTK